MQVLGILYPVVMGISPDASMIPYVLSYTHVGDGGSPPMKSTYYLGSLAWRKRSDRTDGQGRITASTSDHRGILYPCDTMGHFKHTQMLKFGGNTMSEQMIKLIKLELARKDAIIESAGYYTAEAEEIDDRIAWYCMRNNISIDEFNAIFG